MELVFLLGVLLVLSIAAIRWGFDSRESTQSAQSAEAWLAARGYAWGSD
jgi:hypothetical protein